MHELELRKFERPARGLEVELLAARHAARAGGERQRLHHLELPARIIRDLIFRNQLKSKRLECIANEQRSGFVVLDVHRGLAAAQDIVVHARQIVVHERIGVDQLDRRRGDLEPLGRGFRHLAGGEREQRPHALAAFERRVTHRFVKPRRRDARRRQHAREHRFHARLDSAHPGLELAVKNLHRARPRPRAA
jgi:hypothetical protein